MKASKSRTRVGHAAKRSGIPRVASVGSFREERKGSRAIFMLRLFSTNQVSSRPNADPTAQASHANAPKQVTRDRQRMEFPLAEMRAGAKRAAAATPRICHPAVRQAREALAEYRAPNRRMRSLDGTRDDDERTDPACQLGMRAAPVLPDPQS